MMQGAAELVRDTYDRIAGGYDDRWSRHVAGPQARLTRGLRLRPGDRVVDLACGTGIDTLAMRKQVAWGEVVAVDCSEGMLREAARRAAAAGLPVSVVRADAEAFVAAAPAESFDAVSLRFGLAYVDRRALLPDVGRVLRPGGRIGVLTSLASCAPQAYAVYCAIADELGLARVVPDMPGSPDEVAEALARGGLRPVESWVERLRLWFDSGDELTSWLVESGYVTHPALRALGPEELAPLAREFARRLEGYRSGRQGIPLDFDVAGVVAARP